MCLQSKNHLLDSHGKLMLTDHRTSESGKSMCVLKEPSAKEDCLIWRAKRFKDLWKEANLSKDVHLEQWISSQQC